VTTIRNCRAGNKNTKGRVSNNTCMKMNVCTLSYSRKELNISKGA